VTCANISEFQTRAAGEFCCGRGGDAESGVSFAPDHAFFVLMFGCQYERAPAKLARLRDGRRVARRDNANAVR
jgi:hypothetical protein